MDATKNALGGTLRLTRAMQLPTPLPKHVEDLRKIVFEEYDLDLTEAEALDLATNIMQIAFLLPYIQKRLKRSGSKPEVGDSPPKPVEP